VPGSQVKADRTCSLTFVEPREFDGCAMAGLGQPEAVISSSSSNEICGILRACCDDPRIGGVHTRDVGVELAGIGLQRVRQRDRGGVGSATSEKGHVAVERHALRTTDDRHDALVDGLADALGPHFEDLGVRVVCCR